MTSDRTRYETAHAFAAAGVKVEHGVAEKHVMAALESVLPVSADKRRAIHEELVKRFPDESPPGDFWNAASSQAFRDFFVWGHNYDWGAGCSRTGAMGPRHIEIGTESIERGFLPYDLRGKRVLDIGCWSGGDLLLLRGLGAEVEAIEEHRRSAESASGLCKLLGVPAPIRTASLYADDPGQRHRFDLIYCSGVIYHVTDPVLFLRICFAYLKVGGRLIVETKAHSGSSPVTGLCGYSGTLEKGWNWFAPNGEALGRWLVDAGFSKERVELHQRFNGRLLACGVKTKTGALSETAGFSRPGSWLEEEV
ncbi:MAG: methyltransferase domain-containing protein [Opitutaceae bacterium]|nr:methyltransferase domain-containing protein [Opitutaceae bacterium]